MQVQNKTTGIPIYVNGHRYQSLFEASIDTGLNFSNLNIRLNKSHGAPVEIKRNLTKSKSEQNEKYNVRVVTENWLLEHPEIMLKELEGAITNTVQLHCSLGAELLNDLAEEIA